jgi:hypothetical protein
MQHRISKEEKRMILRKMSNRYLFLTSALFVGASSLFAAHVTTDYDHSVQFANYKTYSWLKVQANDQLWEDRIKRGIDAQLAAKGWTQVDSNPSVTIAAFKTTHNQQTMETFYDGLGGGWGWRRFGGGGMGMGMATTTVDLTKVGTLVVDIFDAHTKQLVWRGCDTDDLSGNPEKNAKKLEKDSAELFKHFPPEPKS